MDPRVFAMDGVMQREQDAVAAKPEDDGIWVYFNGSSSSMDPRVKPEDDDGGYFNIWVYLYVSSSLMDPRVEPEDDGGGYFNGSSLSVDPRVFAMDGVMQREQDAVAAKPEDGGVRD